MRCMSVCLVHYNMCFVFIADNMRPLEERKQQSLILCAGQAFLHSKDWSIHTHTHTHPKSREHREVVGAIHHSGHSIHTHTSLQ